MNLHVPRRFAVGTPVEFSLSYLRMLFSAMDAVRASVVRLPDITGRCLAFPTSCGSERLSGKLRCVQNVISEK